MSQRSNTIKAAGLYTFLSEILAPEGSLVKADNINIDELGVITPRRGFNDFGSSLTSSTDRVNQIIAYKDRILRHFGSTLQFENASGDFESFDGSYEEIESGFRIKSREFNGNLYFTTNTGVKKISARNASSFTTSADFITNAGAPKAVDLTSKAMPTTGGFLPPQSKVAYRMVFGYRDNNNVLILGSPSSRSVITNTSQDVFTNEVISTTFLSGKTGVDYVNSGTGKYWIFYTSTGKYHVWYNTGSDDEPQTSDTLGSTSVEVKINSSDSHTLIANKTANSISTLGLFSEINLSTSGSDEVITLTYNDTGDIQDPTNGDLLTEITVSEVTKGTISEGSSANVELSFIIPNGVTTDYFYQIYRTPVVTTIEGVDIDDLDPGEDYNLVFEGSIEQSPGTIVSGIEDLVSETFRAAGTPLYSSRTSGEGILQTNDRPPIAKDMELFQNFMFYANTKSLHRFQFSILSVDDFQSNITEFVIGNNNVNRTYTFRGSKEVTTLTCGTQANTTETNANDSYVTISSANDERSYYIWFDKGSGIDPQLTNSTGIRIDLSNSTTAEEVATKIENALSEFSDFSVSRATNVLTITNTNNGPSTDADTPTSVITTDIGTGWALSIVSGEGADTAGNFVLLSGLTSVAQSIDETARSLVSIINQDTLSPVNAFYLSGADDLPGQILLENKSLEDVPFYTAVHDTNTDIGKEFSPEIPFLVEFTGADTAAPFSGDTTKTEITVAAGHPFVDGDTVYVYMEDNTFTKRIEGAFEVSDTTGTTFVVDVDTQSFILDPTTGFYFSVTEESDNEEFGNRIYYSKVSQPEAVPLVNFIDVGGRDSEIERILALRDNLFVFKTDGIYILSGFSAPFSVRLLDNTAFIVAPDSAVVLNNQIFCLTNQGIATVTETSPTIISRPIENLLLDVINDRFDFRLISFGVSYENDKSYLLFLPEKSTDTVATQAFRYNTYEKTWTRWTKHATSGLVKPREDRLYLGDGDRNYLLRERKERNRTDYSDRNFSLIVPDAAVNGNQVRLSDTSEVSVGDMLVQEQSLSIVRFNRLLKKLDLDPSMESDYESTLSASPGDSLANKMFALNTKIVADDASGTVTIHTYSNTNLDLMKTSYNELIGELNNPLCDTLFKTYTEIGDNVFYEGLIMEIDSTENIVTLKDNINFVESNIECYKGYEKIVQWNPLHYGDPSALKQVREGTIIFDQNTICTALVGYSTDLSPSFIDIPFEGNGAGFWGAGGFGSNKSYWGGEGNDVPFRTVIPRTRQKCRYLNVRFEHINSREGWRILGITTVIRAISSRAYR